MNRREESKSISREELVAQVHRRRLAGQKVVFTNGCFDLLHPGHVRLLRMAADLGDYLVVGVNSDASAPLERSKPPNQPGGGPRRGLERARGGRLCDCVRRRHPA